MLEAKRGKLWPSQHYGFVGHCHVHGETRRVWWRDLGAAACRCCEREGRGSGAANSSSAGRAEEAGSSPYDQSSSSSSSPSSSSPSSKTISLQEQQQAEQEAAAASGRHPPLALSGPLWTGPLHDRSFVEAMQREAHARGWSGHAVAIDSPYREKSSKNNRQRPLEELLQLFWEEADEKLPAWYLHVDEIARRLDRSPSRDELIEALKGAGFAACRCHVEKKALKTNASMSQVVGVAEGCGYRRAGVKGGGGGRAAAAG